MLQPGNRSFIAGCAPLGSVLGLPAAESGHSPLPRLLESHIKQGADLEDHHLRLGIVAAIVGSRRYRIHFSGQQNHAGTTRMAVRKDAGVALVQFVAAIEKRFPAIAGPRTVWTTDDIKLDPGADNIVPGGAELVFQFRDTDLATLDALDATMTELLEQAGKGRCAVSVTYRSSTAPSAMDPGFQFALQEAAQRHAPGLHQSMPSGAGHDAQIIAQMLPSAMLFVPSIGGISHHYSENTRDEDNVLGCQVFCDAAAAILAKV